MSVCGRLWLLLSIAYGVCDARGHKRFSSQLNRSPFQNQMNFSIQLLWLWMLPRCDSINIGAFSSAVCSCAVKLIQCVIKTFRFRFVWLPLLSPFKCSIRRLALDASISCVALFNLDPWFILIRRCQSNAKLWNSQRKNCGILRFDGRRSRGFREQTWKQLNEMASFCSVSNECYIRAAHRVSLFLELISPAIFLIAFEHLNIHDYLIAVLCSKLICLQRI